MALLWRHALVERLETAEREPAAICGVALRRPPGMGDCGVEFRVDDSDRSWPRKDEYLPSRFGQRSDVGQQGARLGVAPSSLPMYRNRFGISVVLD